MFVTNLLDVPHIAVDSDQGEVILSALIELQSSLHVGLALQVLGPPLIDVPGRRRGTDLVSKRNARLVDGSTTVGIRRALTYLWLC